MKKRRLPWCYTAFIVDAYAPKDRGLVGGDHDDQPTRLDAVDQAVWTRHRDGRDLTGLIVHHDHGVQCLLVAYPEHLVIARIKPSTGAIGSSYDNALAELVIGLYNTGLIKPRKPWKGFDDLELATAE